MKRLALLLSFAGAAACGGVANALGSPVGNYTLISVDGLNLPAVIGTTITVRGSVNLKSGGDYTFSQADSAISGAVMLTSSSGQWGLTDNALSLIPKGGALELGIVTIDTIRLTHLSHTNLYLRH
jgi:hypothetical protein